MLGHRKAHANLPEAARTSRLLSYKHIASISPLECALTQSHSTAHSKELTGAPKPFRMRTCTKPGGGVFVAYRLPGLCLLQRPHGHTFIQVYCLDLSPLFLTHTKTAGVNPLSSHAGTRPRRFLSFQT